MKKVLFIAAFTLTSSLTFANNSVVTNKIGEPARIKHPVNTESQYSETTTDAEADRDCLVTVKGNFQGVEINVELTISDTSYLDCLGLKIKIKALEAFYG